MKRQTSKISQDRTVIFLHIHKTGGRTLEGILKNQYNPQKILSTDNLKWRQAQETLSQYSPTELEKIQLIKGHMYFGIHSILSQPFTYITIFRGILYKECFHSIPIFEMNPKTPSTRN